MKLFKWSVVLLALLLAAMTMVPMVSATDVNPDFTINSVLNGDISLFDELGLQKPESVVNSIPLKTYEQSKDTIEKIMAMGKLSNDPKSVIGLYDFGSFQILLINNGDTIQAVTYDGNIVKTQTVTPKLLGEKKTTGIPKLAPLIEKTLGDTVSTDTYVGLSSVSVESPESPSGLLTIYQVTKTRTDQYRNYLGEIRASLTVKGLFYINYGVSVSSIVDQSSYYTTYPYTTCSYSHYTSGAGTTSGQVNAHLKTGAAYARAQMDNWVGENAWMNLNPWDGGSTSTWMSGNPDGCTG
jgi:hypothetical protein